MKFMTLRDYQEAATDIAVKTAISDGKGKIHLPTASGKSIILSTVNERLIELNPGFAIYVVLTPRILLTNQLMFGVVNHQVAKCIRVLACTIHSGKAIEFHDEDADDDTRYIYANIRNFSTTSYTDVVIRIKEAKEQNHPLIICSTYDSVPTLTASLKKVKLKARITQCDEAHYIVEKHFHKDVGELQEHSKSMLFYTATAVTTIGDDGNGMNNETFYGPKIFSRTPRWMINNGWMVRPRLHTEKVKENAGWATMVSDAFTKHQSLVKYNAKLLVCCNGTKTINEVSSPKFLKWCKENKITLFSISAKKGASIDGELIGRDQFLKDLRAHKGKAIILHINILTEGIDIPDISGVMFIRNMGVVRFGQSYGRAARIIKEDRKKLDNMTLCPKKFKPINWTKPYGWIIVAERSSDDEGKVATFKEIVRRMRELGFEPTEERVIAVDRGTDTHVEIELTNQIDEEKYKDTFGDLFEIQHDIEAEKFAALSSDEKLSTVKNMWT